MDKSFHHYFLKVRFLLGLSVGFALILCLLCYFLGNIELFLWFNQYITSNEAFEWPARLFSLFGEWLPMLLIVLYAFRISLKAMATGLFVWLTGACLSWLFKLWLCAGALRPYEYFERKGIGLHLISGIQLNRYNTFPSGHTLTAFYAIFFLAFLIKNLGTRLVFYLWMLALCCGLSRIVLVQHWPADVAGGIFLGISAAFIAIRLSFLLPDSRFLNQNFESIFGVRQTTARDGNNHSLHQ